MKDTSPPSQDAFQPSGGALQDILILDLSRVLAGPYCTMVLGDYGAEVIKVEAPRRGDDTRSWGPPWAGKESAYFLAVNRNKKSLAINLKHPAGQEVVRELAQKADVLIENFRVGTAARFNLDYESLQDTNPGLIYCSITGYGQDGPQRDKPGYDFVIQAEGGLMSITGPQEGPPHKVGVAIVDITTGLFAANAILAALHHRERTGLGDHIDVSLLDTQIAWLANVAQNYLVTGVPPLRYGNAHPNIVPYEVFQTADGFLALGVGNDRQFKRFVETAALPDLADDPRFKTNADRVAYRETLIPHLQEKFLTKKTNWWLDKLNKIGIPAAPIQSIPEALAAPQIEARAMVQTIDHPSIGKLKLIGPVAKHNRTPPSIRRPPPTLGQHTAQILTEHLGYTPEEIDELVSSGAVA